jgi:hypothetical protein
LGVRGGPDPREGYGQRPSRRVGGTTSQRGSDGMYEYSGSSLGPSEGLWAMKMEDKMWRCRTLYMAGIGRRGVMTGPRVKPSAGTKQQRLCGRGYECEDRREMGHGSRRRLYICMARPSLAASASQPARRDDSASTAPRMSTSRRRAVVTASSRRPSNPTTTITASWQRGVRLRRQTHMHRARRQGDMDSHDSHDSHHIVRDPS